VVSPVSAAPQVLSAAERQVRIPRPIDLIYTLQNHRSQVFRAIFSMKRRDSSRCGGRIAEGAEAQRRRGGQSHEGTKIVSRFPPLPHRGRPGGGTSRNPPNARRRHAPVPVTMDHHHAAPARPRQGKPRMSESPTQSSATMHNARPTPPGPKSRMSPFQSCSARVLSGVCRVGVVTWIACVGGGDQVIRL
jgi:hypothetical protein